MPPDPERNHKDAFSLHDIYRACAAILIGLFKSDIIFPTGTIPVHLSNLFTVHFY